MTNELIQQSISLLGAILVLTAYLGHQMKQMKVDSISYNLLNVAGSSLLTYVSLYPLKIGFLVAEGTWLTISIVSLFNIFLKRNKYGKKKFNHLRNN